ncbi:RNA polymerase sigma factor RpoD [Plesiocystis pacifica SIR-1]|uniref:RNA polymerase sigma factor n=1 Tax=Plesiocystis pacifica SIR-1 TaxID=391625 RepID=A6GB19_9BACT|nr:sigma-70 family RNA polymerase sigma factor [Plesiocystis pacifica]EDM76901.1 RNA polymerase sigma factor RpoD [Plesiocystis pacifica SIR-1]
MGACETYSSDEEQSAAVRLRKARSERWAALVSYPPLYPGVRKLIDERLEVDAALSDLLDRVGVAAEAYRKRRTLANEAAFAELCVAAGEALPEVDVDSELAERLIADVDRIANNERDGLLLDVPRMPGDSRPFRIFHERCRRTAGRVRKYTNDFAKANLRLVVSLARRLSNGRLPLQDLIQEGNIGLLKAIERFDHRKGFRFSTYASWWIRHSISRAIYNKGRQVRLPVHVYDVHQKITRVRRRYEAQIGREPTHEEIANEIGVPLAKVEKIAAIELGPIVSLDAPLSRNDDRSGVDLLEDQVSPGPGFELELGELEEGLEDALSALRPMEADILRRRYGLDGVEKETLREIGERYALSRERIRQLQERAVSRMREEFARRSLM